MSHSRGRSTWVRNNQFQENESEYPSDEVFIAIMGSISLDDAEKIEISPSKD